MQRIAGVRLRLSETKETLHRGVWIAHASLLPSDAEPKHVPC